MDRALWAGPGVSLHDGPGVVEYALHPGGYIRFNDDYVLVAHPRAPRGPLTLLVTGLHRTPLEQGARAEIANGALRVGALSVDLRRVRAHTPRKLVHPVNDPAEGAHERTARASGTAGAAPPSPAWLAPGLDALARGDLAAAVLALAGRGEGLTPVGDDVLAGFAAMRYALGRPVFIDTARCSPLGRAYLRCAERGEVPEDLSRWGATSGTAMLWGMRAAA